MAPLTFLLLLIAQVFLYVDPGIALPLEKEHEYKLHEKRGSSEIGGWQRIRRVDSDAIVPLRIGLTQTNLDAGYDRLMSVSDPNSSNFGTYLTASEVHDLFSPSAEAVGQVREWLSSSGINGSDIVYSENKGWLALEIPALQVERLFRAEIHEYEHDKYGRLRLGCDEYHVPVHLSEHIDYITPGVKLSHTLRKRSGSGWPGRPHGPWRRPAHHHHRPWPLPPAAHGLPPNLRHCDVNITPHCWRALYHLPRGTINDPANSPGFFEQGDYYSQKDLDLYFQRYAPWVPEGTTPIRQLIDGAKVPVPVKDPDNDGENDLDLQIGFSLVYPTIPTVYQVDDRHYAVKEIAKDNLFNTFLDAVGADLTMRGTIADFFIA